MPPQGRTITLSHLGRVEGHGGIRVRITGDVVDEVKLDVFEGSRYYEALLKGKYVLDEDGRVEAANVVTPTAQNLLSLECDMQRAAQAMVTQGVPQAGVQQSLEMLARAYDPCISCAVHVVWDR